MRFKLNGDPNVFQKYLISVESLSKMSTSTIVFYNRLIPTQMVSGREYYAVSAKDQVGPIFSYKTDCTKYLEVDINSSKTTIEVS